MSSGKQSGVNALADPADHKRKGLSEGEDSFI
jgi:hypothetical protein